MKKKELMNLKMKIMKIKKMKLLMNLKKKII